MAFVSELRSECKREIVRCDADCSRGFQPGTPLETGSRPGPVDLPSEHPMNRIAHHSCLHTPTSPSYMYLTNKLWRRD
jgi:hypothetical protein